MDILTTFSKLDLSQVQAYIRDRQEENLHLEFKTVGDLQLDKHDRKNLATALSGFANSDGGLIVWGVVARDLGDGVDCANDEKQIDRLPVLMASLNKYTGELVNPDVEGVVHKPITTSGEAGFAVTIVPASDSGPHMAKGTLNRYYKRSGSRFIEMEHFDIEDMFGRRKKPRLTLYTRIQGTSGERAPGAELTHVLHVIVGIRNEGRGTAKSPFVDIAVTSLHSVSYIDLDGLGGVGPQRLAKAGGGQRYGALSGVVIHPGMDQDVTKIIAKIPESVASVPDLVIHYSIAAEDMRMIEAQETIPGTELMAAVKS